MADLVYFPYEYQLLVRELMTNHLDLAEKIKDQLLEESLGTLAAEFNILCDGTYDLKDICTVLLLELKKRNTSLILLPTVVRK